MGRVPLSPVNGRRSRRRSSMRAGACDILLGSRFRKRIVSAPVWGAGVVARDTRRQPDNFNRVLLGACFTMYPPQSDPLRRRGTVAWTTHSNARRPSWLFVVFLAPFDTFNHTVPTLVVPRPRRCLRHTHSRLAHPHVLATSPTSPIWPAGRSQRQPGGRLRRGAKRSSWLVFLSSRPSHDRATRPSKPLCLTYAEL
jgi:hypothetical protein